jgi:hypothetical protein
MSFTSEVNDMIGAFDDGVEATMRGTSIKLWSAIIKSSPVDEGRFRGNWLASFGESSEVTSSKDLSGVNTINKATQSVLSQPNFTQFTLTNNLPYAEVIEFGGYPDPNNGTETVGGFSKSAPQGVVRVNVKRFRRLIEAEARRRLPR